MKIMLTFFTLRVLCIMNSYIGINSESLVLSLDAETSKRKCQEKKGLSCGETTPGSSIMTMRHLMLCY
jgi:hypothetical protein